MSDMKKYLDQFRVRAGLRSDDRVLNEAALFEDKQINELERAVMDALEKASSGNGKDDWSYQTAEWTETHSSGDGEDRSYREWEVEAGVALPLAAYRPTVVRQEENEGKFTVVVYFFAAPGAAGKIERNTTSLSAATKKGLRKYELEEASRATLGSPAAMRMEPSLEPPDYGDDEGMEYDYGSKSWRERLPSEGEERLEEMFSETILSEILPKLVEKALPQMDLYNYTHAIGGSQPDHYGWFIGYFKSKK